MTTDIEIASTAAKRPMPEVAAKLGIPSDALIPHGHDKAKIEAGFIAGLTG
ncbi:MAG: formate--tetrahydrofolate ligase, partial [Bosea sp. (in: a-proteobacteria)]